LRSDEAMRLSLGWHKRHGTLAQPWVIPDAPVTHRVRLRFAVHCAQPLENIHLAMEDTDVATVRLNGKAVDLTPDGWYVDKSIHTVPLGTLRQGENVLEITLPFGKRTNVEWCYLLGDFAVQVFGEFRLLTPLQDYIGFDDITRQGLAHYGGNLTYQIPVCSDGGDIRITVPHYAGAALKAKLAGVEDYIVYAPYQLTFRNVPAGEHTLELTLLGNRNNSFGPVHMADTTAKGSSPRKWRTVGSDWTESYRLRPLGVLSAPVIEQL